MSDTEVEGTLDIFGKGQVINGKNYHESTFTDKFGNQYPTFICVFEHKKIDVHRAQIAIKQEVA